MKLREELSLRNIEREERRRVSEERFYALMKLAMLSAIGVFCAVYVLLVWLLLM